MPFQYLQRICHLHW